MSSWKTPSLNNRNKITRGKKNYDLTLKLARAEAQNVQMTFHSDNFQV